MWQAPESPYRIDEAALRVSEAPTQPPSDAPDAHACRERLDTLKHELDQQQRLLAASGHHALLLIFQAMDAAGKDSTIRAVLTGVNPAGCEVHAFQAPTPTELAHDFLWRSTIRLPARGRIGVFNRSYYEEVLIARVHPGLLAPQKLPLAPCEELWQQRFHSIRDHELHLARNGTAILKFWLNVSAQEQRQRFLKRLRRPDKHWKFALADVEERRHWHAYMHAYEEALNATSRPWAPWYALPADDKPYLRLTVAQLVLAALHGLELRAPATEPRRAAALAQMRERLEGERGREP
jgi:PPK2 family polyphosphate:nucleotide phosphotransferase